MNKSFSLLKILFVSAILLFLISCASHRKTIKTPIKEEGVDYLFEKLIENEFKFKTFSARYNIEYTKKRKTFELKGQIRIIKDSLIWVSFTQDLGIEMARLLITLDSVKFIDRFHKQYFMGDYDFVNNFLNTNIDFGVLQSIVLGNDFEYYENVKFKTSIDGGLYRLSTGNRSKLKKYVRNSSDADRVFLQSIWLKPENFKITQIKIKELTKDSKKLHAFYSDFKNIEGQLFPFNSLYKIETDIPIKLDVEYSKIVLNQKLKFPFKIPSKYKPAD